MASIYDVTVQAQNAVLDELRRRRAREAAMGNAAYEAPVQSFRAREGVTAPAGRRQEPLLDTNNLWQIIGQIPSGLISSTIANTAADLPTYDQARAHIESLPASQRGEAALQYSMNRLMNGYRPAVIDAPLSTFGAISSLVNPGSVEPDSTVGRSMERTMRGYDRTNRLLGVTDPQNAGEAIFNVMGSMLIPAKVPRLPVNAATMAGRAAQRTRNFAVEASLPLRNTTLGTATAFGSVFGVGIPELLEATGLANNPEYKSITEALGGGTAQAAPAQAQPQGDDFANFIEGNDDGASSDDFLNTIEGRTDAAINIRPSVEDVVEDTDQQNGWGRAAIALGVLGGGGMMMRYARGRMRANAAQLGEAATPELMGTEFRNSRPASNPIATVARRVVGAAFRQDQPIRAAILDHVGPNAARRAGHDLDLLTNTALGAKYRNLIDTGSTASGFNSAPIGPVLRAFGDELDPQAQRMVENALLAGRALDDLGHKGVQTAFPDTTPAQLRAILDGVRNNPQLAKYLTAFQQSGRDLLAYRVHGGVLSQQQASQLMHQRPNYAPLNRAVVYDSDIEQYYEAPFTANRSNPLSAATDVEGGSVREGATGSPIQGILQQWADSIRLVEQNRVRANVLDQLNAMGINPQTRKPWVQRLPARASLHDGENIHTVFENGQKVHYRVTDPALNLALHFSPRATVRGVESIRQGMQNMLTGPLGTLRNLFSLVKSPAYDSLTSTILRPSGTQTGALNEMLLRLTGGRVHVGALDPTQLISGFTGMPKMWYGQLLEGMSSRLTAALIKDHSYMLDAMRAVGIDPSALQGVIARAYDASTKSMLDQLGISSQTLYGTPDPRTMLTNMHEIAPRLSTDIATRIYQDAKKGDVGFWRERLAGGRSAYAKLRANGIVRLYMNLLEAAQNGAKAQALGTTRQLRRAKKGTMDMTQQAAAIRRMSIDSSQHGGSNALNRTLGQFMYFNTGMQSLYELGHAIKTRGPTLAMNLGLTTAGLVALNYAARLNDPEAAADHDRKTPEQRAASVTMPGGAEFPVDPLYRTPIFATMEVLDQLSGINNGSIDPSFARAIDAIIGDNPDAETWREELGAGLWSSVTQSNPVDPQSAWFVGPVLALMGQDPQGSRMARTARDQQTQQVSGLDQDSDQTDALLSEYWQNMLYSVSGAFGRGMYESANDFHRSVTGGSGVEEALDRAAESWQDQAEHSSGLFRPLFGNYEHLDNAVDSNWQQYNERKDGIERAINVFDRDVRAHGVTSRSVNAPQMMDIPLPEFRGTRAAMIGYFASELEQQTGRLRAQLRSMGEQAQSIRNRYVTPRQQSNRDLNTLNAQRRDIALRLLMMTRQYEQVIGRQIGQRNFTFRNYNPRDYMEPVPQAPQPQPQQ